MISRENPWIRLRQPQPEARLRLFCFPFAGGGATTYRTWQEHLSPLIEVYPVQLPGHENRIHEPPFRRMDPLVEAICNAIFPYLDRPYAVFGHSLGTIIGYEVCTYLQRHYRLSPALLAVSARRPPHVPVGRVYHDRPWLELAARLQELGGTPSNLLQDRDWIEILEPMVRADLELHENYQPRFTSPLYCPLVALGGMDDPEVSRPQLEGWRRYTNGDFQLKMFSGGHFYLNHCREMLAALKRELIAVLDDYNPITAAPVFSANQQQGEL